MKKRRVLIFPGGTEIGLEIWNALKDLKEISLFSVGLDIPNHAEFVFKNHEIIPSITTEYWLKKLNNIIIKWQIQYIFPAHDDVLVALKKNETKIIAKIITSPLKTVTITRSKSETYSYLQDIISVPKQYTIDNIPSYPVFVKPDKGQGSLNTMKINKKFELSNYLDIVKDGIILEYLPGKEYTIDCFSDRNKGLLFCCGRERIRIRSGISMTSESINNDEFYNIAKKITSKLVFHGAWFFQLKETINGNLKLLEIAPRISGTMATHRVIGVNFPLLSIYETEKISSMILTNNYSVRIDRALINRYKTSLEYKYVYTDLDDFLILENKVNINIVKFLYQCYNKNKNIILLTRHIGDINDFLDKFAISKILFNKIICVDSNKTKSEYIFEKEAIFLDDSFSERKDVHIKCGIATFDSSMIEVLLDERS